MPCYNTLALKLQKLLTEEYEVRFRSTGLGADLKPNSRDRLECQIKLGTVGWSGYGATARNAFEAAYKKVKP